MHPLQLFCCSVLFVACNTDKSVDTEDVKTENAKPVSSITSHTNDVEFHEGTTVLFEGTVSDEVNSFDELDAKWLINGTIVCDFQTVNTEGTSSCESTVSIDDNEVTLVVRDTMDETGEDTFTFKVIESTPPTVEITNPVEDGIYYSDMPILFEAIVSDAEEDASVLIGSWESNSIGMLEEIVFSPDSTGQTSDVGILSTEGEHTVSLSVTDS